MLPSYPFVVEVMSLRKMISVDQVRDRCRNVQEQDAEVELDLKRKRTEDEAQDSKAETVEKRACTMPEI